MIAQQTRRPFGLALGRWLLATLAGFALIGGTASAQDALVEGRGYIRLAEPQQTESGAKVEVIEFFSYGCVHCYRLEEHIGAWAAKLPPDVNFIRVPVFSAPLARVHYALEALGRADLGPQVFKAIHETHLPLQDEKTFFSWAASNGIDAAKLKEAWDSFTVTSKVSRTRTLSQSYGVTATPTVVVDGKFVLQYGPGRVDFAQTSSALAFLIGKARSERK